MAKIAVFHIVWSRYKNRKFWLEKSVYNRGQSQKEAEEGNGHCTEGHSLDNLTYLCFHITFIGAFLLLKAVHGNWKDFGLHEKIWKTSEVQSQPKRVTHTFSFILFT